eukprot:GEMP01096904.1.p1 GENE.GEMP01096904.1~~GEMP01096904.1.p1  ORF type:complete len:229 (+),score=58.55 GEMP01096904.1:90-776(+)
MVLLRCATLPVIWGAFLARLDVAPTVPPALIAQNVTLGQLETRLGNMTTSVQQAQLALDTLAFKLANVEGVTGQSRINVVNAMNTLKQVSAAASVNRNMSIALRNQSTVISTRVSNASATLTNLSTRLTAMEQNSKLLGSDAVAVAEKVTSLDKLIKEAMPGGDISDRLSAIQKKLTSFEGILKKGIDAEVKKDIETLMNKVRKEVTDLGDKMEQGEWMPTPLSEYPQ